MNGLKTVFLSISVLIFLALGIALGCQAFQFISFSDWLAGQEWSCGILGLSLIILGLAGIALYLREVQPEPAVAFENPDGEVKVTLSAIEDFVRRLTGKMDDVRELKPKVVMTKKGLEIRNRVVLEPNVNIPQVSLGIQEMIKRYLQEVLGITGMSTIKVLVVKIAPEADRKKKKATGEM